VLARDQTPLPLAECTGQLQTAEKCWPEWEMGKQEVACNSEQISETASTLSWLSDQVESSPHASSGAEAQMVDALSLARSYVVEIAVHRSLGLSDSEAIAATARRELRPGCVQHFDSTSFN